MARITIDGVEYETAEGDNLLSVVLGLGLNLPYFCWHPALGSVGACRQCAVKEYRDLQDTRGKLVMACMVPVRDGARFSILDKEAQGFRASIIEWLMLNHPHDCPVCDEGGECHLQDMTVMTGHVRRRAHVRKRTFISQDLGPFVTHEMNRCIACYRCVRFYQNYAGGSDLRAFASKDHVWFGREQDGALESPFSGNLVEVCPTGVFTDKTLARHYTRKWDLQSAPTVCVHCGQGCNTLAAERYGTLRRITNRYHRDINGWFLCDRGRFGYEFVNGDDRLREPRLPDEGSFDAAWRRLLERLKGMRLVGIGSPRAGLEANYALRRLVGAENFFSGLAGSDHRLARRTLQAVRELPIWTLHEAEACDAVLVLGEDVEATNPRLSLALRQSVRHRAFLHADELGIPRWQDVSVRDASPGDGALFVLSPLPTALDAIARAAWRQSPEQTSTMLAAVAARVRGGEVGDAAVEQIVSRLQRAERIALVVGAAQGSESHFDAAVELWSALHALGKEAGLLVTAPECNTVGSALLDGRPLEELATGEDVACIVLENDLFRRLPAELARVKLQGVGLVVALDAVRTPTTDLAHAVLPVAPFAEGNGLYLNCEGRLQRSWQVYVPPEPVRESWRWLARLGSALGRTPPWQTFAELFAQAAQEFTELAPAVAPLTRPVPPDWQIPRESHRYSGRTAQCADRTLFEPPPPKDPDSPFTFSMEGYGGDAPPGLAPRYWKPGWNSWQALLFHPRVDTKADETAGAGLRLWPTPTLTPTAGASPPSASGRWRAVPWHHVFGGEELSSRAPAIASRASGACIALDPDDAAELGVREGESMEIECQGSRWHAPVKFLAMARGLVAVPVGMAPFTTFPLYLPVGLRRVG